MKLISSSLLALGLGGFKGNRSAIENHEAIGNVEDVVNVVAYEEDRAPAVSDLTHEVEDLAVSVSESAIVGSSRAITSASL